LQGSIIDDLNIFIVFNIEFLFVFTKKKSLLFISLYLLSPLK